MKQLTLSKKAILELIIKPEVTSEANYKAALTNPVWPGGASGMTVGLGYDLGTQTPAQIKADLAPYFTDDQLLRLVGFSGKLGNVCKKFLPVSGLVLSWSNAVDLFYKKTLKKYARAAASIYPELETLHPFEQTAIVGLVYNRGTDLKGSRRVEMLQLVQTIKDDNDARMAGLIRHMKRLWDSKQKGLLLRRELEAWYIEQVDTPIPEEDKLMIVI